MGQFQRESGQFCLDMVAEDANSPAAEMFSRVTDKTMTMDEFTQTIDEILFANIDVTAAVIAWTLIHIAQTPGVQTRLLQDFVTQESATMKADVLFSDYICATDTMLHWTIMESMRLSPPTFFSLPEQSGQHKVQPGGGALPAGTPVIIDAWTLNRRSEVWGSNSFEFDPTRFRDLKASDYRYSLWRFEMGPRNCVGQFFADKIIKMAVYSVLKRLSTLLDSAAMATGGFDTELRHEQSSHVRAHELPDPIAATEAACSCRYEQGKFGVRRMPPPQGGMHRDKRRRIDDDAQLPAHSVSSTAYSMPSPSWHHPDSELWAEPQVVSSGFAQSAQSGSAHSRQGPISNSSHGVNPQSTSSSGLQLPVFSSTIVEDPLCGTIPDAMNDTFWWLASQWQSSSTCDSLSSLPEWTNTFNQTDSTHQSIPNNASIDADSLRLTTGRNGRAQVEDATPPFSAQGRNEASAELHHACRRCLPERSRWPTLLVVLERLCRTAHGGSEAETSPFLCLSKLQEQLELDTVSAQDGSAGVPDHSEPSSSIQPDPLRCAWTLAAICLAESILASSPIELPRNLTLEELDHEPDNTVLRFTVAWDHCRKGLCGDPIEVMQTYRMMSLAFSRCHQGQELASASVFLGCRAAATLSIHRAATIAHLGSSLRQQQALNAFWHLVSQGCHFQAWQGRDMPIDLALVELPMPDPKASIQQEADSESSSHTAATAESPRSQFLSSSPVFVTRIWTSVAIGQTIERHYRQGARLLVPCETRLEVATPMTTRPSHQEQVHVKRTAKALDFCGSLLQTREPARADNRESQLKRFVLMLMRYTRVLLHYPFCRVDIDHRKAAQESISATVSTVLGTLLSLGAKDDDDEEEDGEEGEEEDGGDDLNGANHRSRELRGSGQDGSTRSDAHGAIRPSLLSLRPSSGSRPVSLTQPDLARSARVDRHLLELLAGLSLRALVFTLALIKHPLLPVASDSASSADDSERQRSDALLALGALEQLHQHGVVSPPLLRKARKAARLGGGI